MPDGQIGIFLSSPIRKKIPLTPSRLGKIYWLSGWTMWSWHPLLVSSWRWRYRPDRVGCAFKLPMTVTKRIRRRGEQGISR
jgi:hypothetical protein